jgi:integrase
MEGTMYAKRTLSELWNSYKRSREFLSKAGKTQKCYAEMMVSPLRFFRGFIVTYADERKRLTGAAVDRYISYRMSCPSRCGGTIAPTTIQKELVVCSNAVKYARRREYVDIPNPFIEADIRCEQVTRDVVLPREKDLELLMALPQPARDIVEFALVTGFRKGEILALTHERIFRRDGKCLVEFAPQDQKSRRRGMRALSQRAVEIVLAQGHTTGLVFMHNGGKIRDGWLRYNFLRALRVIGLDDFTFHDLRHTYFTRRVEEGKSISDLSEQAGHSTVRTLERVYVQSTGERAWRAVN